MPSIVCQLWALRKVADRPFSRHRSDAATGKQTLLLRCCVTTMFDCVADPALVWRDKAGQKRAPNPFEPSADLGIWVAEQFDKTWQTPAPRRHVPCEQTATSALRHPTAAASSQLLHGQSIALQQYTHPGQATGPLELSPLAMPSGNAHHAEVQLDTGSRKELYAQQPISPFRGMANTPFFTPVQLDPYSMSQHLQATLHARGPAPSTADAAAAVTPAANTEADDAASATKSECTQPRSLGPGSKRVLSDVEDPDTPNLGETPPQAFGRRRIGPPADSAQAHDSSQKQDDASKLQTG